MTPLLSKKRIFLVGGPGGVGKTTLSATLAIEAAKLGKKTVVLTVDPAKRLAQAMGFKSFSSDLQKVSLSDKNAGELYASMLDRERYFDKVIARFAKNEIQKEKILNNRLYRTMVESLGGTDEYAAMERLLEFAKDSDFEKIIIDTPPTQNAMDLLSAPERLANFMDNSVLKWFQKDSPKFLKFFKHGTKLVMKLLEKVLGEEFIHAFSSTLEDLEGMQAGFKERNLEVIEILKSPASCFILVTYPSEIRYLETKEFMATLKSFGISLDLLILNQTEPDFNLNPMPTDPGVLALAKYQKELHLAQTEWIKKFEGLGLPVILVEKKPDILKAEIASLDAITK